jgi:hypothetical protein
VVLVGSDTGAFLELSNDLLIKVGVFEVKKNIQEDHSQDGKINFYFNHNLGIVFQCQNILYYLQ